MALAEELKHAGSMMFAFGTPFMTYAYLDKPELAKECIDVILPLSSEKGMIFWHTWIQWFEEV